MRPEWQAHIDELLERYRQKRDQLQDVGRAVGAAGATVTTEDEMIKVTVGPRGRLIGLEFNPRVYRRMSPSELAAAVLAAADEASSKVDGQVRAALAPLRHGAPNAGRGGAGGTNTGATNTGATNSGGQQDHSAPATAQPAQPAQPGRSDDRTGQGATGADVDLACLLPERPEDVDGFRERYGLRAGPGDC